MITTVLIVCLLIWFPVLLHQITHRPFLVLIVWLFIAPVATNLASGDSNPFFKAETEAYSTSVTRQNRATHGYKAAPTTFRLREVLEPNRLLLVSFLLVFLLNAILRKKRLAPLDRAETWMGVFSLIVLASVLLQSNRVAYGLRTAGDGLILPFIGYYIARRLVTSEDRFAQLTQALGYLSFYVIIITLVERLHIEGLTRVSGPFAAPDHLYMVLTVSLYAVILDESPALPRSIHRFVVYLTPVIMFLTFGRGNWVGFLSAAWVFLFLGYRLIDRSHKMARIGLALLAPLIVVVAVSAAPEDIIARASRRTTVDWRFARWEVAIQEGMENPIFGIGLNNLRDILGEEGMNYATAHSTFLSFFAELGAIGLVAYLAIVVSIVRMGLNLYRRGVHPRDRWRGIAIIAVMTAHFIPAFFANSLYAVQLCNVYVYVFVGGIAGLYSRQRPVVNDDLRGATPIGRSSLNPLVPRTLTQPPVFRRSLTTTSE